jgi:hypothetical protein
MLSFFPLLAYGSAGVRLRLLQEEERKLLLKDRTTTSPLTAARYFLVGITFATA